MKCRALRMLHVTGFCFVLFWFLLGPASHYPRGQWETVWGCCYLCPLPVVLLIVPGCVGPVVSTQGPWAGCEHRSSNSWMQPLWELPLCWSRALSTYRDHFLPTQTTCTVCLLFSFFLVMLVLPWVLASLINRGSWMPFQTSWCHGLVESAVVGGFS